MFQELNISNVSIFMIDRQSNTFLLNIIISDIFIKQLFRIIQRKVSAEKFDIKNFAFKSFINK